MKPNKQKKHCKDCYLHWTHGIKDGKNDNWCCAVGNVATKAISVCLAQGLKKVKEDD